MIIRPMRREAIPDGLRLCRASNWTQLEDDWRVFLDLGGASLAIDNGVTVGSVAWLPFGTEFAWLSMMLVDPTVRRAGIGSKLMEVALASLAGQAVRLDATPAGEPMYRRFGFVVEYTLARTKAKGGQLSGHVRAIEKADLANIYAWDREVFGADRSALLGDLYRRAPQYAWAGRDAYCFGRPGYLFPQIGPVVAANAVSAREVVDHCLASHAETTFVVDVVQRPDGLDFEVLRPFLRMCLGERREWGRAGEMFAITGPEFG